MKTLTVRFGKTKLFIVVVLTVALGSLSMLSRARTVTSNITVVNNSSRDVRHLYLSPPNSDNWSADQLHGSTITPNSSFSVTCNQSSIKVVAEDQDGCFLYQVVDCSADVSWTITNDATRDCGH